MKTTLTKIYRIWDPLKKLNEKKKKGRFFTKGDTWMANKYMKIAHYHRKIQIGATIK